MDYKKRLKIRLYLSITWIVLGIFMIGMSYFAKYDMLSSFGLVFVVMGIARVRRHYRITKDEETLRKYEIAETDERNIKIWTQARSLALSIYIIIACSAVIILHALDMKRDADIVAINIFSFIAIYWVSYFIIRKKY